MPIEKVAIEPIILTPTVIRHHRELPPGHYRGRRASTGQRVFLTEIHTQKLYYIQWEGNITMYDDFEIGPNDELSQYDWDD